MTDHDAMVDRTKAQLEFAQELMVGFAARTGLDPAASSPLRYLWTDAFAVCNYVGFARATGSVALLELARRLVDQVHATLGRDVDGRAISKLDPGEARLHPTIGGLRIGKRLPERGASEPFDEDLEWDRDGQYFHYLTKWMHALRQLGRATGDETYLRWAQELAKTAHRAFSYAPRAGFPKRMYWKMSVDLTRPLVRSMGQHDPLDAWITYRELDGDLERERDEARAMCEIASFATSDPLGLGGLLCDVLRLVQLGDAPSADTLLDDAAQGLAAFAEVFDPRAPAASRLAFRELGLAIGIAALQYAGLDRLAVYATLRETIVDYWLDPAPRGAPTWTEHFDINEVMLATAIAPEGFLL